MIKQSKKLLSLCLALALVLGTVLVAIPVSAAGDMTVNFASVNAAPGETVEVPVTFTNNTGVCSGNLVFSYDSTALEFVDATYQGSYAAGSVSVNPNTSKLTFAYLNEITEADFVVAEFKVKDNAAAGDYAVSFVDLDDFLDDGGTAITCTAVPGKITVSGKLNGVYDDPEITLIDEDFADDLSDDWIAEGVDVSAGVATLTNKPLIYNAAGSDDWNEYTVSAKVTLGPAPAVTTSDCMYKWVIALTDKTSCQGLECSAFFAKNQGGTFIRIYDRRMNKEVSKVKVSDIGLTDVVDYGKTFNIKVVFANGFAIIYINDTLAAWYYFDGNGYDGYKGSFGFAVQNGQQMTVDDITLTKHPATGRNKTLHNGFWTKSSEAADTVAQLKDLFYGYTTSGTTLTGKKTNPYYNAAEGYQVDYVTVDGVSVLNAKNGTFYVADENALNWKNYDAEVSLKLDVKNSAPAAYDTGTEYAALVFGGVVDDADKKTRKDGNRFAVTYDRSNSKYLWALIPSGNTKMNLALINGEVPAECGIGAFDDTNGSPFFKLRVELFGALAKFYINDVYVDQYIFTAPVVGTAGMAMSSTKIYVKMKDLVVVTDYATSKTPRTPDEGEVFFEGFDGDYGPANSLTVTNNYDVTHENIWDFTNGTAKLNLKNASSAAAKKQWNIAYRNDDAYNWSNMTYSTDIKFDWLPANYAEAGRSNDGSCYWGFNVEGASGQTTIEVALYRHTKSHNWSWRILRRNNDFFEGIDDGNGGKTFLKKEATITDTDTLAKLNGKEFVNIALAVYGNQITLTINGVECYSSDEMGYSPAGSIKLATYTLSNSIFEFDNVQVKSTPVPTPPTLEPYAHDFTADELDAKPLTKENGWSADSANAVVSTKYGNALYMDTQAIWGQKLSNVRITAKIAYKWKDAENFAKNSSPLNPAESAIMIYNKDVANVDDSDTFRLRGYVNQDKSTTDGHSKEAWNVLFRTPTGNVQNNIFDITWDEDGLTPQYDITVERVGNFYSVAINGEILATAVATEDGYGDNMISEEKLFNIAFDASKAMYAYYYDIEIEPLETLYTVSAENDAEIAKYPTIGTFYKAAEQQVLATRNFYAAGDTVKIVAENAVVGSVKYTDDGGNCHNIFATGAEKGKADGKTFQFTMPDSDVTVTATAMDPTVQNFGISTLSYSTSVEGVPAAIRFLNRVYLPKAAEGDGFSSTVMYNGKECTVTDIGAIIVPAEVNADTLDLNADSIKKVSVLATNTIYDRTDSYVDFTVYLTNIQDSHLTWNFRVRAYVELFDGENTIVVYGDELNARYSNK